MANHDPKRNGRMNFALIGFIQGPLRATRNTIRAYKRLSAEAKKHGISIHIATPAGAYRSIATQKAMHANPTRFNVIPGMVMAPIGYSSHGWGDELDIYSTNDHWLEANAARFGFYHRDRANDWHCFSHHE